MVEVDWHLKTYPLIIITMLGLFGNTLIFYVFIRKNFRHSSITKYVRILAVVDTIVLCSGTIPNVYYGFNSQSLTRSSFTCILQRFIMFYSGDVAIWILTVMTIDRLIAVVYPLQNAWWISWRVTAVVLAIVFSLAFAKNFLIFVTFTVDMKANKTCISRSYMRQYEKLIRPAISLILYYLIPMMTMTVCTVLIIWKINSLMVRISGQFGVGKNPSATTSNNHTNYSKSLTKMSITINILFFVLITPSIIIWTILSYSGLKKSMYILYDITNIFVFSHHSLNFYLFFLSGPRFRHEVMTIFGKKYVNTEDSRDYSHKKNLKLVIGKVEESNCN